MIFRLTTLEDLKRHLEYTTSDHDARLTTLLEDASAAIMNHLGDNCRPQMLDGWTDSAGLPLVDSVGDPALDSFGDSLVPAAVRRATLLASGTLDANREGEVDPITPAVVSILTRYRTPVAV